MSPSAEKFCTESFTVALISGSENVYGQQGGRQYQDFPSKVFCPMVPKIFVEESFTVAVMSSTGDVWTRRGEYQDFPSNYFRLTVPKFFLGESFTVALFSGSEKIWIGEGRGSIKIFRRKFIVSHCRKFL